MSVSIDMPIEFIEALTEAKEEIAIVTACSKWVPRVIGSDRGGLAIIDEKRTGFRMYTGRSDFLHGRRYDGKTSLYGQVCQTREPRVFHAPDTQGSENAARLYELGYKALLVVPMIANDQVMGTLNMSSFKPGFFDAARITQSLVLGRWIASQLLLHCTFKEMERLAMTDTMTNLPNRRAFMMAAEDLFGTYNRAGKPSFSAVILDLDHFKKINDTKGHEAGDAVLVETASRMQSCLQHGAMAGRLGGEEFGILVPGGNIDLALSTSEKVRAAISAAPMAYVDDAIPVTASLGCAIVANCDNDIDDILRRADAALYVAKKSGRNNVSLAPAA